MLNHLLITHVSRLRKPSFIWSNLLTPLQGRLTGVKLGQQVNREHDFHSLYCVYNGMFKVIDRLLTFSHILYWENIWGPCGDRVIIGFASYRTTLFWLFLNTNYGVHLVHAIGAFCQYFSSISRVRLIHACDLYTGLFGTCLKLNC